jgi:hypothetical protein
VIRRIGVEVEKISLEEENSRIFANLIKIFDEGMKSEEDRNKRKRKRVNLERIMKISEPNTIKK